MKIFVFGFSLLTFVYCRGQVVQTLPAYVRSATYNTNNNEALPAFSNQASLAHISNLCAGVYGEKRFLMQELGLYYAAFAVPTTSGNFGVQTAYFGNSSYNETKLGLAYGRKLGERLSAGVQFNYYKYSIAGYGNSGAVAIEAGLLFNVSEQLTTGVHFNNPTRAAFFKNSDEKLDASYSGGIGYKPSEKLYLNAELIKTENQPIDLQAGVQYQFEKKILARIGMATATSVFYFGAGVQLKDFTLHALAHVHPQLGITPALMLTYKK